MSEHNLYVQNSLAMERFGSRSRNQQILCNHHQTIKKLLHVGTQKPFKGHKTCLQAYSWQSLLYVYLAFSKTCISLMITNNAYFYIMHISLQKKIVHDIIIVHTAAIW